nr:MFS transporter [Candidatus Njordarchaeota archaeon]
MNKLLLYQIFSGLSGGIYGILIMFFIKALFGSGYQLQYALFYLVSNLTMSLLLLPGGALADRIGRRSVLRIGVSLLALSGFIATISTELWQLLIASGMSAAGSAFIGPAQSSLVADITLGYRRQKSYGIITFANITSITIGTLALFVYAAAFQHVLDQGTYYRLMLGVSAVLNLVSAIPMFLIRKSPTLEPNYHNSDSRDKTGIDNTSAEKKHNLEIAGKEEGRQADGVPLSLRRNNVALKIIVINAIIGLGAGFIIPMFSYYWSDVFYLSEAAVYAINILGYIGIGVGSLFSPWLARRARKLGGRVGTIVACQAASIICAGYLAVAPWQMNLYLAVSAYIARQDFMNMIGPLTSSLLMDHSPENRRGVINSLTSIAFNVPNGISPYFTSIILGLVPSPYGYTYSILALVVLYTIATMIYSTTRKADKLLLFGQSQRSDPKISH